VKTTLTARHIDLTEVLRTELERKLHRLDRVAPDDAEANLELIGGASHATQAAHVAELTLTSNGSLLRSTAPGATALAAVDAVLDKLERQIVRSKERPRRVRERVADAADAVLAKAGVGALDGAREEAGAPSVVKTKRFDLTPMFEEDAIAEMDELGHAFFVFLNAETERVAVVYRRRDGNYGLIDPEVETRRRGA
jgi:putative sigma-54 modulation protein